MHGETCKSLGMRRTLGVRWPARAGARVGQGMTEDEAQRSRWTFYEVVKFS